MQPIFTNLKNMVFRVFLLTAVLATSVFSKLNAQTVVSTDYSAQAMSFLTAANSFVTFTVTNSNSSAV
ncbi:MAG: hypothetical protein ACO3EG_01615, partial [Chitinophagaceae bacterium]